MLPTPPASPKPSGSCNPEDRLGQVLAGRIQLTGILGVGAYGTVCEARDVVTNVQYAVKALNKVGLDPRQKKFQDREIQLHYRANHHPNVVSMEKILDTPDCTFVVLEYCPEGDLFSKITEEGDYVGKDQKARAVFLQILDAVRHCHSNGIYHRDLKPENILVKDDGWTVKLADFGLATQDRITTDFGCGSTFYMSPECQQSNPKPFACYASAPNDIWSLGVILVNLTCGRNPWKRAAMEDSTFRAYMRDRNFLQTILPISDGLNCILQRIFEVDPKRRISLDELRECVMLCPSLGQESSPGLLPTPPYSPVAEKPASSPPCANNIFHNTATTILEPVPNMDPLPVQRYPQFCPDILPSTTLPTPPSSATASPRQAPHTFSARLPAPVPFPAPHPHQLPSIAFSTPWARYSHLVPNLATQACWRNLPVF